MTIRRRARRPAHTDKLIKGFLPKGRGVDVVRLLHTELGINTGNVSSARGQGLTHSVGYGDWGEIDILTVAVSSDRADEVFAFIYDRAGVGVNGGGLLFQAPLVKVTPFVLPQMAEET